MQPSNTPTEPSFETGFAAQPDGVIYSYFAYPGSVQYLPCGKLLAVFTAKKVNGPDEALGVYSLDGGKTWSPPQPLFGGPTLSLTSTDLDESYADPNVIIVDEKRVIVQCVSLLYANDGAMDLRRTRFWRRISEDGGEKFGPVEELPRHKKYYVGTIHPGLKLRNGTHIMGYSWDRPAESDTPATREGEMGLVSGALISTDAGISWTPGQDVEVPSEKATEHFEEATSGIAEPAIVELSDGRLFLLGRTPTDHLWQSFSHDGGQTWEAPTPSPLQSHNCPAALIRLQDENTILVVYNAHPLHRARLSASISTDNCQSWSPPVLLAPIGHPDLPEASYPALCQLPDGTIVLVFGQIDREDSAGIFAIRYLRFTLTQLGLTA
jgi:hypothetical protein